MEKLSGQSILYFGPGKWEGMWRNRHHLMSRFAERNRVMYVEPVVSVSKLRQRGWSVTPWPTNGDGMTGKRLTTRISKNLHIYHSPRWLPVSGRFLFKQLTWGTWSILFKNTMKRLGFSKPIIWLSQPNMTHYLEMFDPKLMIYHVVDEYLAYEGIDSKKRITLANSEKKILNRADLVIVVSDKLYETKSKYNRHTHIVKNGVDHRLYARARVNAASMPEDLAPIPRPVIGYSGLVSNRLNLELIERMAADHPQWSLALVGEINERGCGPMINRLRQVENIHFLGMKKIEDVPGYVNNFDACIIPYRLNEETKNLSALKLYDFFASGKPVVTTGFPAVKEFKDLVYIAEPEETFDGLLSKALGEKNGRLASKRKQVASQNTWEHRIIQLSTLIQSRIGVH